MLRIKANIQRLFLGLGDLLVFEGSLFLTLAFRYGQIKGSIFLAHLGPFTILTCIWLAVFYVAGLYDLQTVRQPAKLFRTYLEGMFANFAIALGFFYLIPNVGIEPRTNLVLYFCISLLFGYTWRLAFSKTFLPFVQAERVLFIGSLAEAEQVKQLLLDGHTHMQLLGVVTSPTEDLKRRHDPSLTISNKAEDVEKLVRELGITLIVTGSITSDHHLSQQLYKSLFWNVSLLDRAELEEATTGRIPLNHVNEGWFLQHLHESEKSTYESLKRVADIVLAIPFGLITLILLPFVALITKLSSPGPVFIHQTRVGRFGKPFTLIKLRTMRVQSSGGLSEPNGPQFTADAKTDPRIFPFGRILRQLRIDELPQIWNVLRGDLSIIGPRPERPEFVDPLIERMPYYALRHLTRPGLTGWAQVLYLKPNATIDDNLTKLQYDLYYIKHRSFMMDASILLKTVGIVLRRQGT